MDKEYYMIDKENEFYEELLITYKNNEQYIRELIGNDIRYYIKAGVLKKCSEDNIMQDLIFSIRNVAAPKGFCVIEYEGSYINLTRAQEHKQIGISILYVSGVFNTEINSSNIIKIAKMVINDLIENIEIFKEGNKNELEKLAKEFRKKLDKAFS